MAPKLTEEEFIEYLKELIDKNIDNPKKCFDSSFFQKLSFLANY